MIFGDVFPLIVFFLLEVILGTDYLLSLRSLRDNSNAPYKQVKYFLSIAALIVTKLGFLWLLGVMIQNDGCSISECDNLEYALLFFGAAVLSKAMMDVLFLFRVFSKEEPAPVFDNMKFNLNIVFIITISSINSAAISTSLLEEYSSAMIISGVAFLMLMLFFDLFAEFLHLYSSTKVLSYGVVCLLGIAMLSKALGFEIPQSSINSIIIFALILEAINVMLGRNSMENI